MTADPYRLPFAAYVQLLRLMEGADICQNAKNCRRFVEMIEKYYAAHIKISLGAAAINVTAQEKQERQESDLTQALPQPADDHEADV